MSAKNFDATFSRQIGEHLVVAELGRRKIVATPFAGNVPDIDILAYRGGRSIALQVKALAKGSWSFQITNFCEVTLEDGRQAIGAPVERSDDQTVFVFVSIGATAGEDTFYILAWRDLRDLAIQSYSDFLSRNKGQRPRNPASMHTGIVPKQLEHFRDVWQTIDEQLASVRPTCL